MKAASSFCPIRRIILKKRLGESLTRCPNVSRRATKYLALMFTDAVHRAQTQYYGQAGTIAGAQPTETRWAGQRPNSLPLGTASTWDRSAKAGGLMFSIEASLQDFYD